MANGQAKIINRLGLHARPAMSFVQLANTFCASVQVRRIDSDEWVDGKSIMQMLLLAATQDTVLEITCEGSDDGQALAGILALISQGFDE
ncbi:MAG: HPr family phosphocarrier protein [Phycisphaerales bacterium]|nr:HPr family phosphocarrier protein [Phycisphaerales bacterium]